MSYLTSHLTAKCIIYCLRCRNLSTRSLDGIHTSIVRIPNITSCLDSFVWIRGGYLTSHVIILILGNATSSIRHLYHVSNIVIRIFRHQILWISLLDNTTIRIIGVLSLLRRSTVWSYRTRDYFSITIIIIDSLLYLISIFRKNCHCWFFVTSPYRHKVPFHISIAIISSFYLLVIYHPQAIIRIDVCKRAIGCLFYNK